MISKPLFCLLALGSLAYLANAAPILGFEDESEEDTAIVESTVREVRAVKDPDSETAPANFHKEYDSGDKGDIGYTRQKSDKGKTGYQKFDSFHKKGGDNYAFEKHDSFGLKDKKGASGHADEAGYSQKEGDGKKAKYQASPDDSSSYDVTEESNDGDYDESASDDGNEDDGEASQDDAESASENDGGIQESGHDEADAANYDNPSEYTYGSGNEYDF